jgi:hypothetical protein
MKILVDLFNQIRKKLVIFVHFKGFNVYIFLPETRIYITQILVITICVVLDHNTVIFQKEREGTYKNTQIVITNICVI